MWKENAFGDESKVEVDDALHLIRIPGAFEAAIVGPALICLVLSMHIPSLLCIIVLPEVGLRYIWPAGIQPISP